MAYDLTEMSPDELALHDGVLDAPDDDAPRLVHADWLDEHGRSDQAALIRLQVRRTRDPDTYTGEDAAEERRLLGEGEGEPARRWFPTLPVPDGVTVTFARGMPERVEAVPEYRDDGALAALCAVLPVTDLRCRGSVDISPYLRAAAFARRLARLEVVGVFGRDCTPAEHRAAVAAMAAVRLDGLVTVRIADYPVDVALAGALARPHPLPRLRSLALPLTFLDASVIAVLRAVLRPTHLTSLENGLGDDGAVLLADWPALATVTFLGLFDVGIASAGVRALADSPYVGRLEHLDLEGNSRVGAEAGRRLAGSRSLAALTTVNLRGTEAERVAAALRGHFPNVQFGPDYSNFI